MAKALEGNTASVTTSRAQLRQIGFLPLLALFYGYTAGGPFGYEEIFQGSGPGMSLVFLTFVPFLWSIPISFAAAEMNSILPVQGGFYRWVRAAFGDFEIAESRAYPAVEPALHRQDAVHFCSGKRNRNAPEEGNKSEKDERHSGAGALENLLVAKRAASRIAVEECEKRKEPNLAQLRPRGCHRRN